MRKARPIEYPVQLEATLPQRAHGVVLFLRMCSFVDFEPDEDNDDFDSSTLERSSLRTSAGIDIGI